MRRIKNATLTIRQAEMLKCFLDEYEIRYEAEECFDTVEFEIICDAVERDAIETFFETDLY